MTTQINGPAYDCGHPECWECERTFGPARSKAIDIFRRREDFYATLDQGTAGPTGGRQVARGGDGNAEKAPELAPSIRASEA